MHTMISACSLYWIVFAVWVANIYRTVSDAIEVTLDDGSFSNPLCFLELFYKDGSLAMSV